MVSVASSRLYASVLNTRLVELGAARAHKSLRVCLRWFWTTSMGRRWYSKVRVSPGCCAHRTSFAHGGRICVLTAGGHISNAPDPGTTPPTNLEHSNKTIVYIFGKHFFCLRRSTYFWLEHAMFPGCDIGFRLALLSWLSFRTSSWPRVLVFKHQCIPDSGC